MASSSEAGRGARRRATLIPRVRVNNLGNTLNHHEDLNIQRFTEDTENGKDSGLSSESSTPTGGSPPPRQPKVLVSSSNLSNSIIASRGKNDATRYFKRTNLFYKPLLLRLISVKFQHIGTLGFNGFNILLSLELMSCLCFDYDSELAVRERRDYCAVDLERTHLVPLTVGEHDKLQALLDQY